MNKTLIPAYTFDHEVYILLLQQPQWNDNFCVLMILIKISRMNLNELMEITWSSLWPEEGHTPSFSEMRKYDFPKLNHHIGSLLLEMAEWCPTSFQKYRFNLFLPLWPISNYVCFAFLQEHTFSFLYNLQPFSISMKSGGGE